MVRVNEQEAVKEQSARLLREEMDYFEDKHQKDFSIELFRMYDLYLERLSQEAQTASGKLQEIKPELDKEMAKVMEARQKRRVVEILRERALGKYNKESQKIERKELEELNRLPATNFIQEQTHENTSRRDAAAAAEKREADAEHEENTDLLAEYYQNLGIPDPRRK